MIYLAGYIVIGLVVGYVAHKLLRDSSIGLLLLLLACVVGGVLGGWLFMITHVEGSGMWGSFLTSLVGALLLLWLVSKCSRRGESE